MGAELDEILLRNATVEIATSGLAETKPLPMARTDQVSTLSSKWAYARPRALADTAELAC